MHRRVLTAGLAALCVGCGSGGGGSGESAAASASFVGNSQSSAPVAAACSWLLKSNPDLMNVFFPDAAATYWLTAVPVLPGTRLRIDGNFPDARYFSFTSYTPLLSSIEGLADYRILPVTPGSSPFQNAVAKPGSPYVVYVLPEAPPATPAGNTLYAGGLSAMTGQSLPVDPVALLIYRIYLPHGSGTGNVDLPKLTVELADSGQGLMTLDMSPCQPLPPDGLPSLINPVIAQTSAPQALVNAVPPTDTGSPPAFIKNYTTAETVRVNLSQMLGVDIPISAITMKINLGLFPNPDNSYLTALMTRNKGSLYVVRGKAPRAAILPSDAPLGDAQLRYWSLCTNEVVTQRYVACLVDNQVAVDADGYFTLVVSDPDGRPANAVESGGFSWLPWGSIYPDSDLIYRHMLPSPSFTQSVQQVQYGQDPAVVMGDYYPRITYCDRTTFEAAGSQPADVFKACQASRGLTTSTP